MRFMYHQIDWLTKEMTEEFKSAFDWLTDAYDEEYYTKKDVIFITFVPNGDGEMNYICNDDRCYVEVDIRSAEQLREFVKHPRKYVGLCR